ncbi:nuclear transport factor 2 family protein [Sneathiella glossodoripedis]|uniref:nuclear transport factor 2 family protein n=1 Tax=Sneathiella glossodoripedis TaxID=418853 RepID=UPI00046F1BC3|nr:hypothetical protein [Sneathiella glossodoripedis]
MQSTEKLVHTFLNGIKNGEANLFIDCLAQNTEIHVCLGNQFYAESYSGTFVGIRGAVNLFNLCGQFFKFHKIIPTEFHHNTHKLIVRGDLKCELLSTHDTWNSSWMQIWTFEKEKVSKIRIFADYSTMPRTQLAEMQKDIKEIEQLRL